METVESGEGPQLVDESVPVLDAQEVEDLYRDFLQDDLPEEDDGDEDFEPPVLDVDVDVDEEDEEAGVRRRNIQARELDDLLQDAYEELGLSAGVSPGLKERVLDQLSMHFQLLVQTSILALQTSPDLSNQDSTISFSLGMLEHLACRPDDSSKPGQGRRTRAQWKTTATCWDPDGEGLPPVGIPGLSPGSSLSDDLEAAGEDLSKGNVIQQAVEGFMTPRGGVVWPQLVPTNVLGGLDCSSRKRLRRNPGGAQDGDQSPPVSYGDENPIKALPRPEAFAFSMVEDRLLCRGISFYGMVWHEIKDNLLPHKPTEALKHRYAILSGWVSAQNKTISTPHTTTAPWTPLDDLELRDAVKKHGTRWTLIARDVLPHRKKEALRRRWAVVKGKEPTGDARKQSRSDADRNSNQGNAEIPANTSTTLAETMKETSAKTMAETREINKEGGVLNTNSVSALAGIQVPGSSHGLPASLYGTPAVGKLDPTTAGRHSMLAGPQGFWPPPGMNPLKLNVPVPPLPRQNAWNIAGTALLGGNAAKRTSRPTVRNEPAARGDDDEDDDDDDGDDDDETVKGADDARRSLTVARMAAMTTYGVSPMSAEFGGLWGPGVPRMGRFPSVSSVPPVLSVPSAGGPRGPYERFRGVTSAGSSQTAEGQPTEIAREDGDIDIDGDVDIDVTGENDGPPDRTVLSCGSERGLEDVIGRPDDPGAVGSSSDRGGLQADNGVDMSEARCEGANRTAAYAEDELSDDSDNSAETSGSDEGAPRNLDRVARGIAPPGKLYEEDELSDDDNASPS